MWCSIAGTYRWVDDARSEKSTFFQIAIMSLAQWRNYFSQWDCFLVVLPVRLVGDGELVLFTMIGIDRLLAIWLPLQ